MNFDPFASAAILASVVWAIAWLLAFAPARELGAYRFTRIQIHTCSLAVGVIAYLNGWLATIDLSYWFALLVSGLVGTLLTNLTLVAAIRHGGPRRADILRTSSIVFTAILGYFALNEVMQWQQIFAGLLVMTGIFLSVFSRKDKQSQFEKINSSIFIICGLGLLSGLSYAIGLIILKEPIQEGLHPVAASATRLWVCAAAFIVFDLLRRNRKLRRNKEPKNPANPKLVVKAIIPGFMGYVIASSLLLYALSGRNTAEVVLLGSLSPIIILPIQWLITRQSVGIGAYIGSLIAIIGTYIILI